MFRIFGKRYSSLADFGVAALLPSPKPVKVTKHDTDDLPNGACRGLWVGTAGTASLRLLDGSEVADFPLFLGWNPISVLGVKTGGTADNIWALY